MSNSCTEKCESCAPSFNIFSIIVTASMPVEGFSSLVYDPSDTMPYRYYSYKESGVSNRTRTIVLTQDCERECSASCPAGGGWNCAGDAAGSRIRVYSANGEESSSMQISISDKGNYRKETNTTISKSSSGFGSGYYNEFSWRRRTNINNKYINGALDPSSKSICNPVVIVPNPICEYDPYSCELTCTEYPYNNGGCSNSIHDIEYMPVTQCIASKTNRSCKGTSFISVGGNCPQDGDRTSTTGNISSQESVSSQVKEAEILAMARDAATKKVNLKKQNQNTKDENQVITNDGGCTALSTTCNCSEDKDSCWSGYSNITTPSEFSYTNVSIGAFRIAANMNKEEFSKIYKNVSGTVYFYIDSESEPNTSPCCTSCGDPECFTGEIVGTSSYSISSSSNAFKQDTKIATDLSYSYDSSELYAIHPGKVIQVCYTVDSVQLLT